MNRSVLIRLGLSVVPAMIVLCGCEDSAPPQPNTSPTTHPARRRRAVRAFPTSRPAASVRGSQTQRTLLDPQAKIVHVFVALCDRKNQGIVPANATLENGQDPANNQYWGAMYGVKTFFGKSRHWRAVKCLTKPDGKIVLDRVVFESADVSNGPTYVIADAYDGAQMVRTLKDFFNAAAGRSAGRIEIVVAGRRLTLRAAGRADMVCFVGHNGLMDTPMSEFPTYGGGFNPSVAVVLACKSHAYFNAPLMKARCNPLITTTGLMAPEAYTLDAILRAWSAGKDGQTCRIRAAEAYARYQKCPLPAAMRLFVSGR